MVTNDLACNYAEKVNYPPPPQKQTNKQTNRHKNNKQKQTNKQTKNKNKTKTKQNKNKIESIFETACWPVGCPFTAGGHRVYV